MYIYIYEIKANRKIKLKRFETAYEINDPRAEKSWASTSLQLGSSCPGLP